MRRHRGGSPLATRRLAALLALAAGAVFAPAPVSAAAPAAFGTTTFTSGVTPFTLRRPTSFTMTPEQQFAGISIEGSAGRVAGVVLAAEGIDRQQGIALYALRFNGCWARACERAADEKLFPVRMDGGLRHVTPDGSRVILPAGRYRAYVVSDGAPVTVRVRFDGARGSGRLRPAAPAATTVRSAASSFAQDPSGTAMYSAGGTAAVTAPLGLLFAALETRATMHAATVAGTCYYADASPPRDTYVPGCPEGAPGSMVVLRGIAPFHHGLMSVAFVPGPQEWTFGAYLDGVEVRNWVSPTALLWLSLT